MNNHAITDNLERRENVRINHISPCEIVDLQSGKIHKARMFNYSKNGMYFESDSVLQVGSKVCITIEDSPYSMKQSESEFINAEIRWFKKCKDSYFDFGYGVKLLPFSISQELKSKSIQEGKNLGKDTQRSYRKTIRFSHRRKSYEGIIVEISPSGVFLTCQGKFELGQIISFALPLKKGTNAKIEGQIIWVDDRGIGVVFIKRH